jgi:hypothetical protein
MRHATVVEQVRNLVQQQFEALAVSTASGVEETILIRSGFYCGRRFAVEHAHALWFCEEDQLKFYGADGALIAVLQKVSQRLPAPPTPRTAGLMEQRAEAA